MPAGRGHPLKSGLQSERTGERVFGDRVICSSIDACHTGRILEAAVLIAQGGWRLESAREFAKLSQDMLDGKQLRAGGTEMGSNCVDIWREWVAEGKHADWPPEG